MKEKAVSGKRIFTDEQDDEVICISQQTVT